MVLAAAACCTNTGKGAFILGTSGSVKNEKLTKLFTDLNFPGWKINCTQVIPLVYESTLYNSLENLK